MDAANEARHLMVLYEGDLSRCLDVLTRQFGVLQSRSQLLLTLATITLTITGFSGPRIAASGELARWSLVIGLAVVLISVILILLGTLRIRWMTQLVTDPGSLATAIAYRDRKTRMYLFQLSVLVVGLSAYVLAVLAYFVSGVPA
ncbi:MAG: hypothetical protein PF961_04465 [Planctomycetota bacterium]|jgi:hypothetical protein|nr:hypothetical protein [Planctomycetota bacterium]